MAGGFVKINDLVVGQRYRITRANAVITGVFEELIKFTQEEKDYYKGSGFGESLIGMIRITMDNGRSRSFLATTNLTFELLPAVGGRRSRKSRRSHRKSRKSIRKRVLHMS